MHRPPSTSLQASRAAIGRRRRQQRSLRRSGRGAEPERALGPGSETSQGLDQPGPRPPPPSSRSSRRSH
eukprot:9109045-Lingulodinium_polyedra.AAC.1